MNKGLRWTCHPSRMFPIIPRCCSLNPHKHFREWMDGYTLPGRGVYMTSVTHPLWIYKPMRLGEGLSPLFTVKQQYVSLLCACSSYLTGLQNTKSIKNTINSSLYSSLYPSTLQNKLCLYYVLKLLFFLIIQCLLTHMYVHFLTHFITHYHTCLLRETPVGKINGTVIALKGLSTVSRLDPTRSYRHAAVT